jgi:SAM-dependent methyltransferase
MFERSGKIRANDTIAPKLKKPILNILHSSSCVLDVWCVSWRLSTYLKKWTRYIWLSYSQTDIDAVKRRGHEGYLVDLDKDPIPLDNESVDCIYAGHIIEHIEKSELISLMNEFRRVLKPWWYLILATPTDYNLFFYAEWTHVRPYNHGSLPRMLLDFEFTQVDRMYPPLRKFPKRFQALLRFPLFFIKHIIWKEIFAWWKK